MKNKQTSIWAIVLVLLLVGCAVDVQERSEFPFAFEGTSATPLVVYLTNPQDKKDQGFTYHIRKALNYAKIPFQQTNVANFNRNPTIAATAQVVVLMETKPLDVGAMESLVSFTANGGTVILLNASEDLNFGYLAGLRENPVFSVNPKASGYHFLGDFLPTMKGKKYKTPFEHYGLDRESFSEKVKILATAANDPFYPTILENTIMDGRVIIFNSVAPCQKIDRGLYFSAILRALPQVPYPIVNTGVLFLDDFPSPVYDIKKEPIASEMNLSMASFYTDVWWPDMETMAREFDLEYTAMVCFDYQNKTSPPFLINEWQTNSRQVDDKNLFTTDYLVSNVVKEGHELALHGFNHVSLMEKNWPRREYMETAMNTAYKKWKSEQYAPMPVTYVPPSNYIDSLGLVSIEMAVPSIKYICSTYEGIQKEGGDREFDPDPYNQFFFNFPRITSGYVFNDNKDYQVHSVFLYTGVWSHFIHPDDVYQIKGAENEGNRGDFDYRNPGNYGWRKSTNNRKGLYPFFKDHLSSLVHTYPMLRFMNTQNGAQAAQQWRYQRYVHSNTANTYFVQPRENSPNSAEYWMVYIPQENWTTVTSFWASEGISYSATPFQEGKLAMFKNTTAKISVPLPSLKDNEDPALSLLALQNFRKYTDGERDFNSTEEEIKWLVLQGRSTEAILLLSKKIATSAYTSFPDIKELSRLLQSEDREFEIWPILENAYQENPKLQDELIDLSMQLVSNSDYPSLAVRKEWMERQLRLYPTNTDLWATYSVYFSEELRNLSIARLIQLMEDTNSTTQKTQYATLLADRDPQRFLRYIENLEPCKTPYLRPLGATIAWLYANSEAYDSAILWATCAGGISKSDLLQWYTMAGNLEYLKAQDYPKYIEYLIYNDTTQTLQELMNTTACDVELQQFSTAIAYLFANNNLYRKALAWSYCNTDIAFPEKLYWYTQLQAYATMENAYQRHMLQHPLDNQAKYAMAKTYAQLGMIDKSWRLAATLPYSNEFAELRELLNAEVIYIDPATRKALLKEYPDYFHRAKYRRFQREYRLKEGNYVRFNNEIMADRLNPTFIDNQILAGFSFGSKHIHEFGVSQTTARSLEVDTLESLNPTINLIGAHYSLISKTREDQFNYKFTGRLERSENNDYFFRLLAQLSQSKDSVYRSITATHFPALTGPAYLLDIYNTQVVAYYENSKMLNNHRLSLSLAGNYYSDDVLDGQLTTVLSRQFRAGAKSSWNTYVEGFGMLGSEDRRNGFPYWTIDQRFYGGGGIDFLFNDPKSEFQYSLGASLFADTFSDFFQRFKGAISGEIWPYFYGTASAEFFTLKDFYSNAFNFGVRYYFSSHK